MIGEPRKKNEAILQTRFPGLLQKIAETPVPAYELSPEKGARGAPTLRAGGRWVHSRFDPRAEAQRLAALAAGDGPVVVLGFGLGYAAEAAADAAPDRALIIAEKDPRILRIAFESRDLSALLSRDRVAFVVGEAADGILAALDAFGGKPSVLSNRTLRELDAAWYDEAESAIRAWNSKDDVNAATLRRFGTRWVKNLVKNMDAVREFPGIAGLAGCCEGLPAFIVAAGPSLDEVLPFLPEIARRCVVVAVDTSLRAVSAAGVDPDFVVVVDPQYWNARHLDRCPAPNSALIAESAVYPSVLSAPFARTFLCASLFPLGRYVEDAVDAKGILGAGGSVATTAWDFSRTLGAKPIWTAGLDLSFPERKTHFKGALFEERTHADAWRMNPGELRSFKALRDGFPFTARDAGGGTVLTDKRLSLYASWFERRFKLFPDSAPFSLSAKGLRIEGIRTRPIDELLSLPDRRSEIDARLSGTYRSIDLRFRSENERRKRDEAFVKRVAELENSLEELIGISETAATAAREAFSGERAQRVEPILEKLDRANLLIAESDAKEVAGFLFPSTENLEKAMTTDPMDPLRHHLEYSLLLYEKLRESAMLHLELIKKSKE